MSISRYYKKYLFNKSIDYTDIDLLSQYMTEQGRILPRRITGLSTKRQKKITQSIKRARVLSLIPFNSK